MATTKTIKRKSSVRHTRAIQRARVLHPLAAPTDEQVQQRLQEVVYPAALAQGSYFHSLGLRERTLTLVVMLAWVLDLIWRQIGGVCELVRVVETEAVLWAAPTKVSQQAVSDRLTTLPAELFARVLQTVLPTLQARWAQRTRPLPTELAWALARYTQVLAVDGSTLDSLLRKLGLLKDLPQAPLAGRMTALLHLGSRLPVQVWYTADPHAHDQHWWEPLLDTVTAGTLLIFDLGYLDFGRFIQLTLAGVKFITRAKTNLRFEVAQTLVHTAVVQDQLVWVGQGAERQLLRLVAVLYQGHWYRYLTNELAGTRLPAAYVVALYGQRWRIEDAYALVKRLLGLAYFGCGAQNAIELQLWATWLLYAVLLDLTDEVADALHLPLAAVSVEMVYRSRYFFARAHQRDPALTLVPYLAQQAKRLGILKRPRATRKKALLAVIPNLTYPEILNL
jgi:hypothetical protein